MLLGFRGQSAEGLLEQGVGGLELLVGSDLDLMSLAITSERDTHFFCGYFNLFHRRDTVAFVIVVGYREGSIGLRQLGDGGRGGCRGCW